MRKLKIVLLSGKQGAGKTSLVYQLKNLALQKKWLFRDFKFADPLYEMHNLINTKMREYGIETPFKDGKLLQLLGTDWGRNQYGPNVWAQIARNRVDKHINFWGITSDGIPDEKKTPALIVLDDCRFMNELEIFPESLKIRLECNRDERKKRCDSWRDTEDHPSETQFDKVKLTDYFDCIFHTGAGQSTVEEIVKRVEVLL